MGVKEMKKFVKISSIVVLVLWSLLIILGLSFGTGVARKIVASVKEVVEQTLNNYDLYDVNIIEQREYVAGKTYTLSFDTKGNVKDKDYELLFTVPLSEHEKLQGLEGVHVIGHITEANAGAALVTRDGQEMQITAQGWNAFKKDEEGK